MSSDVVWNGLTAEQVSQLSGEEVLRLLEDSRAALFREALKTAHEARGPLSMEEVQTMILRLGRNDGPRLMAGLHVDGLLTSEAAVLVGQVWSSSEYPDRDLGRVEWLQLFEAAGYCEDGVRAHRPSTPLRLYRGSVPERRSDWSWTDDIRVAQDYAFSGISARPEGRVWTALVPPPNMLARNLGRGEAEYVVNTAGLLIEEAPPMTPAQREALESFRDERVKRGRGNQ